MREIVIAGYYGFGNLGDEMILASLVAAIRARAAGERITVLSGEVDTTRKLHQVDAVPWNDPDAIIGVIARADRVLLGGGGLFHDYWGVDAGAILSSSHWGVAYYAGVAGLASACGVPLELTAVGVGPLLTEDGRCLTREIFQLADVVSVRDAASAAELKALGVGDLEIVPDPAWAFEPPALVEPAGRRLGGLRVGVAVRFWNVGVDSLRTEQAVVDSLLRLREELGAQIILLPFQLGAGELEGDLAVAERLATSLGGNVTLALPSDDDPWASVRPIPGLDLLVGMRLHSLLVALRSGVAVVGLAYDPKVKSLLAAAGLSRFAVQLEGLSGVELFEAARRGLELDGKERRRAEAFGRAQSEACRRALARVGADVRKPTKPTSRTKLGTAVAQALARHESSAKRRPSPREGPATDGNAGTLGAADRQEATAARIDPARHAAAGTPSGAVAAAQSPRARYDIVCYSIIPWTFRWQRPQQLLSRLAAAGHRVFILEMSRTLPSGGPSHAVRSLGPNLWEITCSLPGELLIHTRSLDDAAETALVRALEDLRVERGLANAVSLVQVASWTGSALAARERFGWPVIYDCMDEWDGFPKIGPQIVADEKRLVAEADLVLVSAGRLMRKWESRARRVTLVRNAADFVHFSAAPPLAELVGEPRPRIGYFGAIAPWLDIALLTSVSKQRPEYQFILAGGVFDVDTSPLEALSNVRMLGQRPYAEMPSLLAALDVCLIPFVVDRVTAATDPIKFWEYLCQGKPIVATPLPEIAEYARLYYPASGPQDFLRQLDRAIVEDDPSMRQERIRLASRNDWNARTSAIEEAISEMAVERSRGPAIVPGKGREEDPLLHPKGRPDAGHIAPLRSDAAPPPPVARNREANGTDQQSRDRDGRRDLGRCCSDRPDGELPCRHEARGAQGASGGELEGVSIESPSAAEQLPALLAERDELRRELDRIHGSKLWKAASSYWSARRQVGRLVRSLVRRESRSGNQERESAGLAPSASIVIVTFNNLEWTRRCLQSIFELTDEPSFEVIVVDNDSSDGTREFLDEQARREERLRVLLCESNFGFAAANNRGLLQARGEYLVLLNNDTVVTRGWLAALLRHLESLPTLGLVGPSTNEVANEARVKVGYTDLREMPTWAEEFVRGRSGEREPIAMLAMFCVAMRRKDFERVGLLDERFEVGMFEDDDYSRRVASLGLGIAVARDVFVHHGGRASFKLLGEDRYLEIFEANRRRFEEKWGSWTPHRELPSRQKRSAGVSELLRRPTIGDGRLVVFLPSIGWNVDLVQRPHHLAREFARRGHVVVFDCSGNGVDAVEGLCEVEPNLFLFQGHAGELTALPDPVLWALPYNADRIDLWQRRRVVYDLIDDLSVFPYGRDLLERNHQRMLAKADLVLCVSRTLHGDVAQQRPDALYHPNAVDFAHFAARPPAGEAAREFLAFKARFSRLAGYYGAIAAWLDTDLIADVARRLPDWGFVLIGVKLADAPPLDELYGLDNVLVLPPQRYNNLPAYLDSFDVALIPFRVNEISRATSPLKLYEYLASGTPVVSTPMPECEALPEVRIATSGQQLALLLDEARASGDDPAFVARMRAVAQANSWEARVRQVEPLLAAIPGGRDRA